MNKEKVKESTEKYIDIVLKQAEDKAGVSMTETLVESTSFIEKLSSSLLIISGAAITLGIGNSEAVISALGKGSFKALVILLLISCIIGFAAKVCHAISLMYLNLAKELIIKFKTIFDEFESFEEQEIEKVKDLVTIGPRSPNLERIFSSFIKTLPIFLQKKAEESIFHEKYDGKKSQRVSSTAAFFHVIFFGLQALLVIMAFLSAVLGVE